MEFRILGPLEITDGERVLALGGAKRRAVAAALLLEANRVVASERLIDLVWGDEPPASAQSSLQNHVLRLRRELGDRLATRAPGYVLRVEPHELDLDRFRGLVQDARAAEPAAAAALLDEALVLWRGAPLADVADEPVAAAAAHLGELRLEAVELRIDAQLALGRHAALVPELEALVTEYPFRERLRWQLMLALYRAGRQADALEAFAAARRTLVDALGAEPGEDLQELQRAILRQEAALAGPAAEAPPAVGRVDEARKTVTVLLATLGGAATADPETRREALRRTHEQAAATVIAHGGEPGRTSDDRVLGLFGVPVAREDDALRAVLAACELRDQGLVVRAGVATGDVITGDPAEGRPRVSGPPLEDADRLLAAAAENEVLAGERTWRLVGHAVAAERRDAGHAIEHVFDEAEPVVRRLDSPLVGREHELEEIDAAFRRAVREGRARLVTIFGSPGVGKTRLAREAVDRLQADATCLVGRTPTSGMAPTFAPLRDAFSGLAGIDIAGWAADVLAGERDGELAAATITAAAGALGPGAPVEETAWATRRLLETLAQSRPVVLVLEDLHWASPALLDLVEHVAELARGPILIVALARPDLLDTRPEWAGGRFNAASLLLEPLPRDEAATLLDELAANAPVDADVRGTILESAAGNPLFLEQLLASALEGAAGTVPDSIHALLAARLDRLDEPDREVAQAAAVLGQRFPADLLEALVEGDVHPALRSLARRDLVEPEGPGALGEEMWAFRHVLVRDEAYAGIPKRRRAALHRDVASVVTERAEAAGMDADELIGYHLESAHQAILEVDPHAPELPGLAAAGAARLGAAGLRAFRDELDIRSAASLLRRAYALLPADAPERVTLAPHLVNSLYSINEHEEGARVLAEATAAIDPADELNRTRLLITRAGVWLWGGGAGDPDDVIADLEAAIPVLQAAGDDEMLAVVYVHLHQAWERKLGLGQVSEFDHLNQAVQHARAAGVRSMESSAVSWLNVIVRRGPWPMDESKRIVQAALDDPPTRFARGSALGALACLQAMEGRFDEARALAAESNAIFEDGGLPQNAAADLINVADVEMIAGDLEAAERILRESVGRLDTLADVFSMVNAAWRLALALVGQERDDEAAVFVARAGEADAGLAVRAWRDIVTATIEARRGNVPRTQELLAGTGQATMENAIGLVADMCLQAGEAAALAGLEDEATRYFLRARDVAAELGYLVAERRARERLAELDYATDAL